MPSNCTLRLGKNVPIAHPVGGGVLDAPSVGGRTTYLQCGNVPPHVVGRTVPGAPSVSRRTTPVPRAALPPRPPMRCVTAAVDRLRMFGVTTCNCVSTGAYGNVRFHTYSIPRAQPAHHFFAGVLRYPSTHAGRAWKPAPTVGIRISPTLHQPLSHGAARRDSSPFRGAEGRAEVCGVYALVYHDADTVVFLSPVGGGVLDAPCLRDRRAALDAPARLDRLHPLLPRCARLPSPPNI